MIRFTASMLLRTWPKQLLVTGLAMLCAVIAYAQDAVRPSLAGEEASEARKTDIDRLPYNLLVGPVRWRVSATMGFEYNDNIDYAEVHTQEDVILHPQINFNAIWPVTHAALRSASAGSIISYSS